MVERQPSKLRVAGSNPVSRSNGSEQQLAMRCRLKSGGLWLKADRFGLFAFKSAHVAQSAEHILGKDEVTSSILVMGSIKEWRQLLVDRFQRS